MKKQNLQKPLELSKNTKPKSKVMKPDRRDEENEET